MQAETIVNITSQVSAPGEKITPGNPPETIIPMGIPGHKFGFLSHCQILSINSSSIVPLQKRPNLLPSENFRVHRVTLQGCTI